MVGVIKGIEVVPYNPEWKNEFKKIKSMIDSFIGDLILWNIIFTYVLKMGKDFWSILLFEIICVLSETARIEYGVWSMEY